MHWLSAPVYRTPLRFTPLEVGQLESRLPLMQGAMSQERRIHSIPVTVAPKAGYLYSSEDLSNRGQPE